MGKKHLEATEVAPHGWEHWGPYGGIDASRPNNPRLLWGDEWYVPVKPKPRTWTGTVGQIMQRPRPSWLTASARVTVTEVLEDPS